MKLALIHALALASTCLALACGDDAPAEPLPEPAAPAEETTKPPARTLVEKSVLATSPENLVVDPDFQSLWTPIDQTGYGIYESFVQDGEGEVQLAPITPAGASAAVLSVTPSGQTRAYLVMTVIGGKGPLSARVWVSFADGADPPDVEVASLQTQRGIVLEAEPSTETRVGGTRWVRMSGAITSDLPGLLYVVGSVRGTPARFLAPEVTSDALAGLGRSVVASSAARASTPAAIEAARRFARFRDAHVTMAPPPRPPALARRP
jgi:hypothetical protein